MKCSKSIQPAFSTHGCQANPTELQLRETHYLIYKVNYHVKYFKGMYIYTIRLHSHMRTFAIQTETLEFVSRLRFVKQVTC